MTLTCTVLFDQPQQEIASCLRDHLRRSARAKFVAGFVTVEGIELVKSVLTTDPKKLVTMVVGAGTYRAFEAFDRLIAAGVPEKSLAVHLGHGRLTTSGKARHRFYRYHPMLHSKVYYHEFSDGNASAFIGSHNITGFALGGLNGEASVLIEGDKSHPEFTKLRNHIAAARRQAIQYSPSQKEALAWYFRESLHGIRDKANDLPSDSKAANTIVILAESSNSEVPCEDEIIYFELPLALVKLSSMRAEVHLYLFDQLPANPWLGLQSLDRAIGSCWCLPEGIERQKGGVELIANWEVRDSRSPKLLRTKLPFRPTPGPNMQQVRVQSYKRVKGKFDYLFESENENWDLVLAEHEHTLGNTEEADGQEM